MYKTICCKLLQPTGLGTWKRRTLVTTFVQLESKTNAEAKAKAATEADAATNLSQDALLQEFSRMPVKRIRNFSIIAHVDHGKSTLADRVLELTGAIARNAGQNQVLDSLQVERERGITVKAQTASIFYKYKKELYLLNLIDTPGHVDFSNEVHCWLDLFMLLLIVFHLAGISFVGRL